MLEAESPQGSRIRVRTSETREEGRTTRNTHAEAVQGKSVNASVGAENATVKIRARGSTGTEAQARARRIAGRLLGGAGITTPDAASREQPLSANMAATAPGAPTQWTGLGHFYGGHPKVNIHADGVEATIAKIVELDKEDGHGSRASLYAAQSAIEQIARIDATHAKYYPAVEATIERRSPFGIERSLLMLQATGWKITAQGFEESDAQRIVDAVGAIAHRSTRGAGQETRQLAQKALRASIEAIGAQGSALAAKTLQRIAQMIEDNTSPERLAIASADAVALPIYAMRHRARCEQENAEELWSTIVERILAADDATSAISLALRRRGAIGFEENEARWLIAGAERVTEANPAQIARLRRIEERLRRAISGVAREGREQIADEFGKTISALENATANNATT